MRATFLCLAVLFLVPYVEAAPAPAPGLKAKEKLESLKKQLQSVLANWMKEKNHHFEELGSDWIYKPEVRLLRRVGPERVKAVILFEATNTNNRRDSDIEPFNGRKTHRFTSQTISNSYRY